MSKMLSNPVRLTIFFAVLILPISMVGFGMKFYEFIHTARSDASGAFTIPPMINYMLASLGFLFMLLWAAFNGMFDDIESPKNVMLEREAMLDRQSAEPAAKDPTIRPARNRYTNTTHRNI